MLLFLWYFAIGLVQWAATAEGLLALVGASDAMIPWLIAWFVAMFLAFIPLVGAGAGMYGAVAVWGWDWLMAAGLFFGVFIVILTLTVIAYAVERAAQRPAGAS